MIELNRRELLAGVAATAAASALTSAFGPSPAAAAVTPIGMQAPGFYRYKVGSHEITVVTDGWTQLPLADNFVTNMKKDDVNAALAIAYMEKDKMTIPYSPVVVNTGSKLVAIDTGTGEANFERSKGVAGQYHANLKAAGIDRNAIDIVIISHFHGDHINGLLTVDNKPAFPKAEILVPAPEWKYFMDDGERSRAPAGRMQEVFNNLRRVFDALGRKVTQYDANKEVAPGITSVATYGHTPGHVSFVVASGGKSLYVQSDVTNHPALFARNPGWHAFFDQDGKMAEETRRKVYDMLVADRTLVQGFHYPFPALAHIEKISNGYREVPLSWSPTI